MTPRRPEARRLDNSPVSIGFDNRGEPIGTPRTDPLVTPQRPGPRALPEFTSEEDVAYSGLYQALQQYKDAGYLTPDLVQKMPPALQERAREVIAGRIPMANTRRVYKGPNLPRPSRGN